MKNLKWEPIRRNQPGTQGNHSRSIGESWRNHRGIIAEIGETLKETKVFCSSSSFLLQNYRKRTIDETCIFRHNCTEEREDT